MQASLICLCLPNYILWPLNPDWQIQSITCPKETIRSSVLQISIIPIETCIITHVQIQLPMITRNGSGEIFIEHPSYSVPQNKGPSCFFEVVEFKMADWAAHLYETFIVHNFVLDWDIDFNFFLVQKLIRQNIWSCQKCPDISKND